MNDGFFQPTASESAVLLSPLQSSFVLFFNNTILRKIICAWIPTTAIIKTSTLSIDNSEAVSLILLHLIAYKYALTSHLTQACLLLYQYIEGRPKILPQSLTSRSKIRKIFVLSHDVVGKCLHLSFDIGKYLHILPFDKICVELSTHDAN